MSYHEKVRKTYFRARDDNRCDPETAFKAACLTNMAIAAEADAEIEGLRNSLRAISGDLPWPDPEKGFKDLAREALLADHLKEQG